mgnify:CR=1 FL=1
MMISTKGRYALRIMADVAQHDGEMPVSVREIAQRQDISGKYMEQIISVLTRSGLLRSVRGAQGGYMLARPPQAITVGEILRVMEGELASVDCLEEASVCDKACACPTRLVWQKIHTGVNAIVDGITLADMLNDYAQMRGEETK